VCNELMGCAESVCLTVPVVLASKRQFIPELRLGANDISHDLDDQLLDWSGEQPRPSSR